MKNLKKIKILTYIVCLCGLIALFAWFDSLKLHILSEGTLLTAANITGIVLIPSGLLLIYFLANKKK